MFWQQCHIFVFTKSSNITRIRYTVKISFKTRETLRQRKSAYNALFVYFVFLVCYLPFFPSVILYLTNTSEISFLHSQICVVILNLVFQPFKFIPTITKNFCLHSIYNIYSEALVNTLVLLPATADGRCETVANTPGVINVDISFIHDKYMYIM